MKPKRPEFEWRKVSEMKQKGGRACSFKGVNEEYSFWNPAQGTGKAVDDEKVSQRQLLDQE